MKSTTQEARTNVRDWLKTKLEHAGFTVGDDVRLNRLTVISPVEGVGILGDLKLTGVFGSPTEDAQGEVVFDPTYRNGKDGRYRLDGVSLNFKTLVDRLHRETPLVKTQRVERALAQVRNAADNDIKDQLNAPDGVYVSVYDGKVDLRLDNVSPETAQRILDILKAKQCVVCGGGGLEPESDHCYTCGKDKGLWA